MQSPARPIHLPDFASVAAAAVHTSSIVALTPAPGTGYRVAPDHRGKDVPQPIALPAPGQLPFHLSWSPATAVLASLPWKEATPAPKPPHGSGRYSARLVDDGNPLQLRDIARSCPGLSIGSAEHVLLPSGPSAPKMEPRSQAVPESPRDSSATLCTRPELAPGVPNPP